MRKDSHTTQLAFRALADPTRRDILVQLNQQEMTIGELVEQFDMTRAAVKKHLVILEEGQLISVQTRGRERVNFLEAENLEIVFDWLAYFDRFWDTKLTNLKNAIEATEAGESVPRNKSRRKK